MGSQPLLCPNCGHVVSPYRNPTPTVDIVIEVDNRGIVLIERKNFPHGWALPGGFVDYGEALEQAAVREALEETSLYVELVGQLGAYSDPSRDPRGHTITNVFLARASGNPKGRDDAIRAEVFEPGRLPDPLVFDHGRILRDYFQGRGVIRV